MTQEEEDVYQNFLSSRLRNPFIMYIGETDGILCTQIYEFTGILSLYHNTGVTWLYPKL